MDLSSLQNLANQALSWIGFGTLIGLAALAIVPGRAGQRNVATILMAVVGALVACALLKYFYRDQPVLPVNGQGLLVGIAGAIAMIVFYHVLGEQWQPESDDSGYRARVAKRRRKRQWLEEPESQKA